MFYKHLMNKSYKHLTIKKVPKYFHEKRYGNKMFF